MTGGFIKKIKSTNISDSKFLEEFQNRNFCPSRKFLSICFSVRILFFFYFVSIKLLKLNIFINLFCFCFFFVILHNLFGSHGIWTDKIKQNVFLGWSSRNFSFIFVLGIRPVWWSERSIKERHTENLGNFKKKILQTVEKSLS